MDRHTFLGFLMLSLLIGTALAVDLPSEGQVVLVSADGVVAGTGNLESGDLELELLAGFVGFGTMTVIGEAGDVFAYDVMVQTGGAVVLTESLDDLATLVRGAGGTVDVSLRESGTSSGGEGVDAAGTDDAGSGDGSEAGEPAATVPERADDVEEVIDDPIGRTTDEVEDVGPPDELVGDTVGTVDEATGAGDAVGGESDDRDGSVGTGTDTESEAEPDRTGEDDRPGGALPTLEVPGLP